MIALDQANMTARELLRRLPPDASRRIVELIASWPADANGEPSDSALAVLFLAAPELLRAHVADLPPSLPRLSSELATDPECADRV